ncbi:cysteine-rich RLK (RECEPTOR-like protein kinase) 8 [Hibiscus trionum]|uniref:Cysteine-rich RLK (RECEPTOR-like protein kinase) 8 n=1 Tax=Hibiscus trionum TaxID=183268 RepID=A0A9W7M6L3_HIBTR|nr:cysteine-rich RLK (RECEPTOR-like protein kinase) 8 [Hibiscus trionum]
MDVYNAFLQGDLQEEVYMELPPGFCSQGESRVCRLHKSLYGLKQASRQWNVKLCEALLQAGYLQSKSDYSVFTKRQGEALVMMLIYVDDLLITGNSDVLIAELKLLLNQNFRMKDLGTLKFFFGF